MIIGLSGPSSKKQDSARRVSFPAKISETRRFSQASLFKNDENGTDSSEDSKGSCFQEILFIFSDENHLHALNGEDQGEDDGGGSLAGSGEN